jgi:hypothetical protein
MQRVNPQPEPADFDTQVRQPGQQWLAKHVGETPKDYWSHCKPQLALDFSNRCGYAAMRIPSRNGTVDHYFSKQSRPGLAYEWTNYRYAFGRINSCKWTYDDKILDPFDIQDDWFEIQLPSLQLVLTAKVPKSHLERAKFTLQQLQLQDGDWIIEEREYYYNAFLRGDLTLTQLERDAPLIAQAIRQQQQLRLTIRPDPGG